MRHGVAIVGHDALARALIGPIDLGLAWRPALEGVLEVGERQARMGSRKGRIQTQRHVKEIPCLVVVGLVEAVHVPKAAMIGFPGIQGIRRLQQGPVALDGLDLAGDRGDDPVADLVQHEKGIVELPVEDLRPGDARCPCFDELYRYAEACALPLDRSGHDVVHVERPSGLHVGTVLMQGEHRALRNDEQAAQPGEPCDHVMGETVRAAASVFRAVGEWHHRNGSAMGRNMAGAIVGAWNRPRSSMAGAGLTCILVVRQSSRSGR